MRSILLATAALLTVAACDRFKGNDGREDSLATMAGDAALPPGHVPISPSASPLPEVAQQLLDSGNVAFREKDHAAALAFYRRAADAAPGHAAPWFGTYMVGQAMGDTALADSALRMVRERAPEMQAHPGGMPNAVPGQAPGSAGEAQPVTPHGGPPPLPHGSPAPTKRTASDRAP